MCSKKGGNTSPLDSQQTRLPNRNTQKTTITQKTAFLSQLTVTTLPHLSFYLDVFQWSPYFYFFP